MLSARVEVEASYAEALSKSLEPQQQERFSSTLHLEDGKLVIQVEAKDATALRAALNSYLRVLQAAEKVV